ncbi:HNH endonuclease signature motif containing protein [Jongsikchunia kroppenstedtii]|uniref:HNH endonuclease signature motif containing protein n=1 Tax=Jongsikchunia kroppenstedtii TaxID=1121721 RepID=UPI00037AEA4C|nr:HNH endonuclease signature motif containing protein [Jongsikchunia kroppenstedtii]
MTAADVAIADLDDDELADCLVGMAGQLAAMTCRFLDALAAFDARGGWCGVGIRSCAHWLSWRCGTSLRTGQEQVRVAGALQELPLLHKAFAEGRVSYSKVRAVSRVAEPDTEAELVEVAMTKPASHLERLCAGLAKVGSDDGEPESVTSTGRWRWQDEGTLKVTLTLTAVDGARFLAGVTRAEYERVRTGDGTDVDGWSGAPSDIAAAMVVLAERACAELAAPAIAPHAEVVVERRPDGRARLADGPALSAVEESELRCGAAESERTVDGAGAVLNWGRTRRAPTVLQTKALSRRQNGCCGVPGCGRRRFLHVHHVRFWSDGGATDLANLVLLCGEHHRLLHRGELSIEMIGGQRFRYLDGDGHELVDAPTMRFDSQELWPFHSIDADAILPNWGGEPLDVGYATWVLMTEWERRRELSAAA